MASNDDAFIGTLPSCATSFVPLTKDSLQTALETWCDDIATATFEYGDISTWNTGAVTDMSELLCASSSSSSTCNTACEDFNGDVSSWNVESGKYFDYMF